MKKTKGFTLIELLVVIAIIGILATVVLVSLNSARAKARDSRRISDIKQVSLALEMYASDNNGAYPVVTGCTAANFTGLFNATTGALRTYIATTPVDPGSNSYLYGGTASNFTLVATLEGTVPADIDTATNGCTCTDPAYCVGP